MSEHYKRQWFLTFIQDRIEKGQTESFGIDFCMGRGYSRKDAEKFLSYFVYEGFLSKKLMIYDPEDDAFDEYTGQVDLSEIEENKKHWLYKPTELAINSVKKEIQGNTMSLFAYKLIIHHDYDSQEYTKVGIIRSETEKMAELDLFRYNCYYEQLRKSNSIKDIQFDKIILEDLDKDGHDGQIELFQ